MSSKLHRLLQGLDFQTAIVVKFTIVLNLRSQYNDFLS